MKEQEFRMVPLVEIGHNPFQPRKRFDEKAMEELVASVKEKGVLQPILVRPVPPRKEGKLDFPSTGKKVSYLLVAGERRLRAAAFAAEDNGGLAGAVIPAIVRDLSDEDAFDITMIENLQREDLNELEEAESFRAYLERHKDTPGAAESLAERIGVSSRYVYRRVRVLSLPEEVLESWGKGEIAYGYLEQLVRLEDKKEILGLANDVTKGYDFLTVKGLKRHIDNRAPDLKAAKFDWLGACVACAQNSDVQKRMFGDEVKGAKCLNPKCFKQKQNNWLIKNWKKTGYYKQHGTNGFRFAEDLRYGEFQEWYGSKSPGKKCRECKDFITRLNVDGEVVNKQICVGDKKCFEAEWKDAKDKTAGAADSAGEKGGPRASWHGQHFREAFFREQLPLRLAEVPAEDERALRVALFALVNEAGELSQWFNMRHNLKDKYGNHLWVLPEGRWKRMEVMGREELLEELKEGACRLILDEASPGVRIAAAAHLGIDLEKEWRITQEYLDKKTVKEIHEIAEEFGLWERKEAKTFLYETLLKKRGNFKSCKKPELCRIILESGMDLAGVVPREIRM